MYYYLFEPKPEGKDLIYTRAKNLINLHGISGEMATPGPNQSLEELVTRAADKGYNTIVAVGGDQLQPPGIGRGQFLQRGNAAFVPLDRHDPPGAGLQQGDPTTITRLTSSG